MCIRNQYKTRPGTAGLFYLACVHGLLAVAAGPAVASEYRSYPLRHVRVEAIEPALRSVIVDRLERTANVVTNPATNEILVRGSESAHQTAASLIEAWDRPDPARTSAPTPAASPATSPPAWPNDSAMAAVPPSAGEGSLGTFKFYPCEPGEIDGLVGRLNGLFAQRPDVRIMASPRGRAEVFVVAPEDVHRTIDQFLRAGRPATAGSATPALPPTNGRVAPPAPPSGLPPHAQVGPSAVRLLHMPAREVEVSLRNILGRRLQAQGDSTSPPTYRYHSPNQETVDIRFDMAANQVLISGAVSLVDPMTRLLRYLDQPKSSPEEAIRVVPLRNADPAKVREAARAFQEGYREPRPAPAGNSQSWQPPPGIRPAWNGPAADFAGRVMAPGPRPTDPAIQRVAYYQDAATSGTGVATVNADGAPAPIDETYNLAPDVMVDMFPELDVVILRGSSMAVDRLAELIEAIERISEETEPRIRIYHLQHVDCVSITTVVVQIYQALLGGRQGRVTVLPLVKPNALLMVGWGDAVAGVEELIQKLDEPSPPEARFKLIMLKHASATYVAATIQQLYAAPAALAPRVRVLPDMRLNSLVIQAAPRDLAEVEHLIASLDVAESQSVNQVRMFRLKNSLANDLVLVLREAIMSANRTTVGGRPSMLQLPTHDGGAERIVASGLLNDVQITANIRTNTILVIGPPESMSLIETMIQQLDQPSAVAQIKVFRIINGDATSLVTMLQDLIPSQIAGQPSALLPGADGEDGLVPVRFSIDQRSNSIIAAGSEGDLRIIEALLLKLDSADLQRRENAVYRLKNSPAAAVATTVNEFLRSRRAVQQAAPGVVSPFQQLESEVILVPEPVRNALVVSATPQFFDEIMELIERLDSQPAQVVIQVLIAQVTLNETDEFGVELGLQDAILFDRSVSVGNSLVPGYLFNSTSPLGNSAASVGKADRVGTQGLSNLGMGRINSELGYGGFVFSASSESVSVLIRALQECRRLEVLSRPQVTTLDNQPAYIQVGKRVPRIMSSRMDNFGQTNNVAMENVGLILAVTPRTSPDGKIVMEVDAEKSSLDPVSEGVPVAVSDGQAIRSPAISVTTAQTTVSAANGETIIIGGLITSTKSQAHRQVPYLGNIPILGRLFSYDAVVTQRSELLIILTPRIVTDPKDHMTVRDAEMARLHWCLRDVTELHGDIGRYDIAAEKPATGDAPVIQPRPIDLEGMTPLDEMPLPPSRPHPARPQADDMSRLAPPTPPREIASRDLPAPSAMSHAPPDHGLAASGRSGDWDDWGAGVAPAYHTSVSYGEENRPRVPQPQAPIAPSSSVTQGTVGSLNPGEADLHTVVGTTDPRATSQTSGARLAYGPPQNAYAPRAPLRQRFEEAMARSGEAISAPEPAVNPPHYR